MTAHEFAQTKRLRIKCLQGRGAGPEAHVLIGSQGASDVSCQFHRGEAGGLRMGLRACKSTGGDRACPGDWGGTFLHSSSEQRGQPVQNGAGKRAPEGVFLGGTVQLIKKIRKKKEWTVLGLNFVSVTNELWSVNVFGLPFPRLLSKRVEHV